MIMASLTWTTPERTTASAVIWSPAEKTAMSSRTMWSVGTLISAPSRTTVPRGAASSFSLSMVRLERISWKMPMAVLATAMKMKVASL